MTADPGSAAGCPGCWGRRAEESALTAPQPAAAGIGPPAPMGRPERSSGVAARARAMLGRWDARAAGTPGDAAPVGVQCTLTQSAEPPET